MDWRVVRLRLFSIRLSARSGIARFASRPLNLLQREGICGAAI
jgi:hypothetical protein